jgi:NhaP-type Na+/H+ or K+/H+ antiporter
MTINPVLYYCLIPPAILLYLWAGVQVARHLKKLHKTDSSLNAITDVVLWPFVLLIIAAAFIVIGIAMLLATGFMHAYTIIDKAGKYLARKIYGNKE